MSQRCLLSSLLSRQCHWFGAARRGKMPSVGLWDPHQAKTRCCRQSFPFSFLLRHDVGSFSRQHLSLSKIQRVHCSRSTRHIRTGYLFFFQEQVLARVRTFLSCLLKRSVAAVSLVGRVSWSLLATELSVHPACPWVWDTQPGEGTFATEIASTTKKTKATKKKAKYVVFVFTGRFQRLFLCLFCLFENCARCVNGRTARLQIDWPVCTKNTTSPGTRQRA